MTNQSLTFLTPIVPERTIHLIRQTIQEHFTDCKMYWNAYLNTAQHSIETREHLEQLLNFCLTQLNTDPFDERRILQQFQLKIIRSQPWVQLIDILSFMTRFEEWVMSLIWRQVDPIESELAYRWLHAFLANLTMTAMLELNDTSPLLQSSQEPTFAKSPASPIAQLLNGMSIHMEWSWIAMIEPEPVFRVIHFLVPNANTTLWQDRTPSPDESSEVQQVFHADSLLRGQSIEGVTILAKGATDERSIFHFQQITLWFKQMMAFSHSMQLSTSENHRIALYEMLLDLDAKLICAQNLTEVFDTMMQFIYRIGDFKRCALFLYSPLTQSAEGIYAHNLDLEDIRSIRENQRRIPIMHYVMKQHHSVYYDMETVAMALPDHYVRHFHLSALLVSPLLNHEQKPIGILLLDHGGKRFHADEKTIQMVDAILSRVANAIKIFLYESRNPITSPGTQGLTKRELQILHEIASGLETKEVARELHISEHTVTEHISAILRKLHAKNRTEAVAKALRSEIIH